MKFMYKCSQTFCRSIQRQLLLVQLSCKYASDKTCDTTCFYRAAGQGDSTTARRRSSRPR